MSISQHRMIALINAAIDYKRAYENLLERINFAATSAERYGNAAGILQQLGTVADTPSAHFQNPIETASTLIAEYNHFRRAARRNDREAHKAAIRRANAGVIPRATSPRDSYLDANAHIPKGLEYRVIKNLEPLSLEKRTQIDQYILEEEERKRLEELQAETDQQDEDLANQFGQGGAQ